MLGHAIDVTDRVAIERSLRKTIEQRETLSFLADFSDRLSPLVTFDELVDVVQRLPVPFVADAAMVHTAADDGSAPLVRGVHGNALHEPALAPLAAALIRRGGSDTMTTTVGGATAALVPLALDGRVKAVLSLVSETERRLQPSKEFVLDEMARRIHLALDRIQLYREAPTGRRTCSGTRST